MARQQRVADHIVDHLASAGVEYIFGVGGANIEDLYDAAYFRDGINAVLAKHEFSAATMADGYSRATADLGVVMATSGGGSLNLVPALGESLASGVPVLALVGQPPTSLDGRGSFQDTSGRNGSLDASALFSAVSVFCTRVDRPEQIAEELPAAIAAARRGGPSVLLLPKDIQQASVTAHRPADAVSENSGAVSPDPGPIARALRRANGPIVIIAGEQVARDDARAELEQLRSILAARVAVVPDAKDVSSDADLGVTGVMGHQGVAAAVRGAGLCLVVGTRLAMTARAGLDEALTAVPAISIGAAAPFVPCTHIQCSDLREILSRLAIELSADTRKAFPVGAGRVPLRPPAYRGPGIRYRDVIAALDGALPPGADIVADAGNTGAAAIHHLSPRRGGRFLVALGMGGMGYSFGAGVGMAFGRKRRTVVIAGDGAFFMHGMEIHTAVEYRLPVTFVLLNNNAHAMCVTREQLFYDGLYTYNRFSPSRLGSGLARMFPGLESVDVDNVEDLPSTLRRALSVPGPSVVSITCSADEIPPFAPFMTAPQPFSGNVSQQKGVSHDVAASA
jgi:acetolactate synthase I/II/III large subunit